MTEKNDEVVDLVGGYEAYTGPEELDDNAASDAPETSPVCVSFAVSAASGATYEFGC